MKGLSFIVFTSLLQFLVLNLCSAADTISPSQSITGSDTLVSSGASFELGLFSPGNSGAWYLGIWYKKFPNIVVWVANRENPIPGPHGALKLSKNGSLVISNQMNNTIWSSNSSRVPENPVAQLLETGNLVVRDSAMTGSESYVWQSFDFSSDTLLAGMKLGWNFKRGLNQYLTSWKNATDPSLGAYTYGMDNDVLPQFVFAEGSSKRFRTGPWNGLRFPGSYVSNNTNTVIKATFVYNTNEIYYTFEAAESSITTRLQLSVSGVMQRLVLNKGSTEWALMYTLQNDQCNNYGECGANGICRINKVPICDCLQGFVPKSPQEWVVLNGTSGCKREMALDCQKGEGFLKLKNVKLPDLLDIWVNKSMSTEECEANCLKNCSCIAFANSDIRSGGSGCVMWFGNLIDMREFVEDLGEQDIFIRMPASELGATRLASKKHNRVVLISVLSAASVLLFLGLLCWCVILKQRRNKRGSRASKEDLELPQFDFHTIATATDNFSSRNKLGEGGFGPVYKAKLTQEESIAVKRLSKHSGQGVEEFKNEVTMIANLQHRNLIKLLGCCIEGEERMLIYEYMPNKSLDFFIFDQNRKVVLRWQKRFDIIVGLARGLLYLHQDSRVRIIHRDLKSSNILLDDELNPKISDFGIARIFGNNQSEAKTKRVIGTYGYLSPEYAIDGKFSVKSDVFSFGVILLEIISGRKNRGFHHPDHYHSLLGHAWLLWNKDKGLKLLDPCLENSYIEFEVLRCIQVGLLCVQKLPKDRPEMSSVLPMLSNEGVALPQPKEPGFFTERSSVDIDTIIGEGRSHTGTTLTITMVEAR
ncbi:G-type lectin S-receptor-like serine/threonine-protein kinase At4g27290 [Rosa rugosa]|uniref:G-type lectin S-receptor-like serine/threonine-protein kinase At4g27290 n=1 Tax=Rosa rugosa TaxID=74645 RepID=UPI002B40C120|nr:G-type lectin S-receptor-like serine/threonine-protein kinase At4g27290 [Rosa rugosa]